MYYSEVPANITLMDSMSESTWLFLTSVSSTRKGAEDNYDKGEGKLGSGHRFVWRLTDRSEYQGIDLCEGLTCRRGITAYICVRG